MAKPGKQQGFGEPCACKQTYNEQLYSLSLTNVTKQSSISTEQWKFSKRGIPAPKQNALLQKGIATFTLHQSIGLFIVRRAEPEPELVDQGKNQICQFFWQPAFHLLPF